MSGGGNAADALGEELVQGRDGRRRGCAVRAIGALIGIEFGVRRQTGLLARVAARGVMINWTLKCRAGGRLATAPEMGAADVDSGVQIDGRGA